VKNSKEEKYENLKGESKRKIRKERKIYSEELISGRTTLS
jgi:hypothetical protein